MTSAISFLLEHDQLASLIDTEFGYVILNIIKLGELFHSLRIISALRNYIKHSFECFIVWNGNKCSAPSILHIQIYFTRNRSE